MTFVTCERTTCKKIPFFRSSVTCPCCYIGQKMTIVLDSRVRSHYPFKKSFILSFPTKTLQVQRNKWRPTYVPWINTCMFLKTETGQRVGKKGVQSTTKILKHWMFKLYWVSGQVKSTLG